MAVDESIPDVMDTGPWTNADVAEHLGISLVHLSRLRHGGRKPSWKLMRTIHERLGWTFSAQSKVVDESDPLVYARALQDFLYTNFHVPRQPIKPPYSEEKS